MKPRVSVRGGDGGREAILRVLSAAGRARVPVLLWGSPGTGKSALVEALAHRAGIPCEVVIGSTREPSDFLGLPVVADNGSVRMAPPDWFLRLEAAGEGILFLDELSCSPPAVQAAMLRVARERWVGSERLPEGVIIVAAANPTETAADGWDLAPPTANRFLHIDWRPSADDWVVGMTAGFDRLDKGATHTGTAADGARVARWRALVAAFIARNPCLLQSLPSDAAQASRAWPSMRTWSYAADVLAELADDDAEAARLALTGLVGEGAGIEFLTWQAFGDLPDPSAVLADPATVDWRSERTDRSFAILSAVAAHVIADGSVAAWQAGCDVLGAVAAAGAADVGAVALRSLLAARPDGARLPSSLAKGFAKVLRDAGLVAA